MVACVVAVVCRSIVELLCLFLVVVVCICMPALK